jgi:hypothetical protein
MEEHLGERKQEHNRRPAPKTIGASVIRARNVECVLHSPVQSAGLPKGTHFVNRASDVVYSSVAAALRAASSGDFAAHIACATLAAHRAAATEEAEKSAIANVQRPFLDRERGFFHGFA